jgi:hypothetical protein
LPTYAQAAIAGVVQPSSLRSHFEEMSVEIPAFIEFHIEGETK